MNKTLEKEEFGDFQTPDSLAAEACRSLADRGLVPASIVEPTCGKGAFLAAALRLFPDAVAFGADINKEYVYRCREAVAAFPQCEVRIADFFQTDWLKVLSSLPDPILVVGNPPWVTNAALSSIGSSNLPVKANFQGHKGLDAITGKSNFDISESMLLQLLGILNGREATLAMLCKTVVARRVLQHCWKHGMQIQRAEIHHIDAADHFNASVGACLFCCDLSHDQTTTDCTVYDSLGSANLLYRFGYADGRLISDLETYHCRQNLAGSSSYRWRSGVKHDCSKVMELTETPQGLQNGLGELVEIEDNCLYPMLKSSELANGRTNKPRRWMIVTQQKVGQETALLESQAPKTWNYLLGHAHFLDRRGSSIYRNRPQFSVFGIGKYSFALWKIAISGFYKSLNFAQLGPFQGKPIVLDDTAYLLPCESKEESDFLYELLTSDAARDFYSSLIFWDAKRPITTELLSALSLEKLAVELGREDEFEMYSSSNLCVSKRSRGQRALFE